MKTSETLIQCQSQLNKSQKLGLMDKFTFLFGTTTFLVNNSPLTKYHSLICPRINESLPQILTKESIEFAIDAITGFNDRSYRIGYNSLGALASVNHLHMHLIHVPEKLYVEDAVSTKQNFVTYCWHTENSHESFFLPKCQPNCTDSHNLHRSTWVFLCLFCADFLCLSAMHRHDLEVLNIKTDAGWFVWKQNIILLQRFYLNQICWHTYLNKKKFFFGK